MLEKVLAPSHQWRVVSGARVSPELLPGFLEVDESRELLFLQMGSPAHLGVQIALAGQSIPELGKGARVPGGGGSLGESYGEGSLRGVD